jgi:hypothetical protein
MQRQRLPWSRPSHAARTPQGHAWKRWPQIFDSTCGPPDIHLMAGGDGGRESGLDARGAAHGKRMARMRPTTCRASQSRVAKDARRGSSPASLPREPTQLERLEHRPSSVADAKLREYAGSLVLHAEHVVGSKFVLGLGRTRSVLTSGQAAPGCGPERPSIPKPSRREPW